MDRLDIMDPYQAPGVFFTTILMTDGENYNGESLRSSVGDTLILLGDFNVHVEKSQWDLEEHDWDERPARSEPELCAVIVRLCLSRIVSKKQMVCYVPT